MMWVKQPWSKSAETMSQIHIPFFKMYTLKILISVDSSLTYDKNKLYDLWLWELITLISLTVLNFITKVYRQGPDILAPFWNWIFLLSALSSLILRVQNMQKDSLLGVVYWESATDRREKGVKFSYLSPYLLPAGFYKLAISLNHRA